MAKPMMSQIFEDGQWLWCVEYAGMRRYYRQDWQAKSLYDYCLDIYRSKLIIDQDGPA